MVVDHVNSDSVTEAPKPQHANLKKSVLITTAADLRESNLDGSTWLVELILLHRRKEVGTVEISFDWVGD